MRARLSPDGSSATSATVKNLTRRAYVDLLRTASAACR
ncbi:putative leader peptide [Kineosporia corallincola]